MTDTRPDPADGKQPGCTGGSSGAPSVPPMPDTQPDTTAATTAATTAVPAPANGPSTRRTLTTLLVGAMAGAAMVGGGTAAEKAAAEHVVKVQGADKNNDILDAAEVYTDYTGGMTGPHQGDGKLLASAFADWRTSKNGLVTVYDEAGDILSNGNY